MELGPLLADLQAEHDDLARRLDGQDWQLSTPAEGWNVHDTVAHLQAFDGEAAEAATDHDGFTRDLTTTLGKNPLNFVERMTDERCSVPQDELQQREPTARLKNVAHLGVRTRGFAFANAGQDMPTQDVRVELQAPTAASGRGGAVPTRSLAALDFCLLVTQRRARHDLALTAEGPTANAWLEIAQCFAGPPGKGRS